MRVALVQQHAVADKTDNINRGLTAMERAARSGADVIAFAELAVFMRHRRPELYARWFSAS